MKQTLLVTILISFACCSQTIVDENYPEFELYVKQFDKTYHTKTLTTFQTYYSDKNDLAFCIPEDNVIQVNLTSWKRLDGINKEWLMFHELGHCVLGLEHNTNLYEDGYPKSIMYPVMFSMLRYYRQHHDEYIKELNYETENNDKRTPTDDCIKHIVMLKDREKRN